MHIQALLLLVLVFSERSQGTTLVSECQPHIEQLFLGFRHGARATFRYLPDDPNNDFFTVGPAQLTKTGLRQMYVSGQNVRQRYAGFIRVPYVPEEVRIRSTVYDRTVMSVATFAAALFQPTGDEIWLPGLHWQPVAIFTSKNILAIDPSDREIMKQVMKQLTESDTQLMETVIEIEKATDTQHKELFQEFFNIIENFKTEMFYNLTLPYDLDNRKHQVDELINKLIINSYAAPEIFCLNAPSILNDIIQHTDSYIGGMTKQYLNVYSLHDGHITSVLAALTDEGMAEMTPFAATFFVEIHVDGSCKDHIVKLLYRSDVTEDAKELQISGCGQPCYLDKFRWIVRNILAMCEYDTTKSLDDDHVISGNPYSEQSNEISNWVSAVKSGSTRLLQTSDVTSSTTFLILLVAYATC